MSAKKERVSRKKPALKENDQESEVEEEEAICVRMVNVSSVEERPPAQILRPMYSPPRAVRVLAVPPRVTALSRALLRRLDKAEARRRYKNRMNMEVLKHRDMIEGAVSVWWKRTRRRF